MNDLYCQARQPDPARISYAQNMEDILLDRVFHDRVGTYMDIGANHPIRDSNTHFFYVRGWRGTNIEPNPSAQRLFTSHRPQDLNLSMAVSDTEGVLPYYEVLTEDGSTGLSTLDRDEAERYRAQVGMRVSEHDVPVRTIASLVEEYGIEAPDFLSIDVESHEHAVIRGIPFENWCPGVLVVESTRPLSEEASHLAWEPILLDHGYLFVAFNGVNRFYLRGDLEHLRCHFDTPVNALDQYLRADLVASRNEMETYRDRYERERADHAFDLARHEELKQAWEWGQMQARYVQAIWEAECSSFARERESWLKAHEQFETMRSEFERQRATWEEQAVSHARERAAWEQSRAALEARLTELEQMLRPYRRLDPASVIPRGYGWAKRIRRHVAM